MPGRLEIVEIGAVKANDDRSVDIQIVDRVRGEMIMHLEESNARWLFASGISHLRKWDKED